MKKVKTTLTVLGVGLGLLSAAPVIQAAAPAASFAAGQDYHDRDFPDREGELTGLRRLVDQTQSDLKNASEFERSNEKQRQRFRDAQGHLSTLDKDLSRGKWGGEELDKSIDSMKSILDKNVLQATDREAILRDLEALKIAKVRHRH